MSGRILIKGGWVLTLGAKTPNYAEADVLVENDRIAEVGPKLRARDAEVIDAAQAIVMPGFVDGHRHVWKSLFRNMGETGSTDSDPLSPALYGPHYSPDDVYAATLAGLLSAVEAGITTLVDWSDITPEVGHVEAALQAHHDAGLRTVFVHAIPDWIASNDMQQRVLGGLVSDDTNGQVSFAFGARDPVRSDLDRASAEWAEARELGLRIHSHVGGGFDSQGVIAELGGRGLLGEDVTLIHGAHLGSGDLDAIADNKTGVVLAPASEMAAGAGIPPIQELIDRGIRPGLGVDSERITPGDIFAQMRAANSVQHATHFDLKLAGKGGLPSLLTTREVIRFATVDGARVAGLGEVTGSLEPGKSADIVLLETNRPNIWPINDPIGAVVWGMDTSNVAWVICKGRVLMRAGELTADVPAARQGAVAAHRRVAGAAGLMAMTAEGM